MMKEHHGSFSNYQQLSSHHDEHHSHDEGYPMYKRQEKPWLEKMMEKIVMEKMSNKFNSNSMDFSDMMDSMSKFMDNKMSESSKYSSSNYDSEKYDVAMQKMLEEQVKESMMEYKMKEMNPFGEKATYRERMAALLRRHKRSASIEDAISLPGTLDLGDRLAEKIEEEQKKMEAKVGNMTCVLREIGILDANNELDFESEKRVLETYDLPDQWFKNRIINGMEDCNKMVEAIPADVTDEMSYPGMPEVFRIKAYMKCCKKTMLKNCMYKDVKEKLETNFGSLEDILKQTQLNEEQLFPLVIKLLHGDEMEYV